MHAIKAGPWRAAVVALPVAGLGAALLLWSWRAGVGWFERHMLISYCASTPAELRFVSIARASAAIGGAVALLVFAPLLARWGSRRTLGQIAVRLVGVLAALAASLPAVELLLRRQESAARKKLEALIPIMPKLRNDPMVGWALEPSQTREVTIAGRTLTYAVNADGYRTRAATDVPDLSKPTILVSGESFGFGHGIGFDETIGAVLERQTGIQVVNLSVVGYGSDQAYLRLMDQLPRFAHPVAVVVPFLPVQIGRNGKVDRPHLVLRQGDALAPEPTQDRLRLTRLWTDEPYHGDEPLETTRAILRATAAAAHARGARPLFVVIKTRDCASSQELSTPWTVDELFDREQLPYVRMETEPDESISPEDSHPGPVVARRIADAVSEALKLRERAP